MPFNQVVRGSNPRCLSNKKAENFVESRFSVSFLYLKKMLSTFLDIPNLSETDLKIKEV